MAPETLPMDQATFRRVCDIAYQKAGICLGEGKQALLITRVSRRLRALGLSSLKEYIDILESERSGSELVHFLDVMSTNFTSFFREQDHFDDLSSLVKEAVEAGRQRIRVWSAGCSTGEEPYTLAMVITEAVQGKKVDYRILATDISTMALKTASEGKYDSSRLAPVAPGLLERYFSPTIDTAGVEPSYRVRSELRQKVVFKRLNLATPPFPMSGPLDAIFCRNVMIYFDNRVRQRLIAEMCRLLGPGGMLFIGHSESLSGIRATLAMQRPSVYRR